MTSPVLTIPLDDTINDAAERMLASKVRHLVVVDPAGNVAGLLSEHDLTHAVTKGLIDYRQMEESAFLRTLINTLPDLVWLKDTNGVYLACNPRFERFFGAQENDIVGKTDYDFVDKDLADFFRENDRKAMEKGGPSVNEEWVTFADDGHRELLETLKTPMYEGSGKLIGVLGIGRDISQRKQNEAKLRDQSEFLDSIFESALDAYVLMNSKGFITGWNSRAEKMFGWKRAEVIGRLMHETIAPARYREAHVRGMETFLDTGAGPALNTKIEMSALRRDGHEFPAELSISSIKTVDGYVFSAFICDITERKRLEQQLTDKAAELSRSEEKLRTLIEAIPDPIQFKDGEGRWLESNLSARQAFGLEHFACQGKTDEELSAVAAPPFQRALLQCRQTDEQAWNSRGVSRIEEIFPLNDGRQIYFDVIKKPLSHADGQRAGLVIVGRDITELRQSQEALAEREELFRAIFEQASNGVELIDLEALRFVESNPAACRMLGYSHEEYLQLRLIDTRLVSDERSLMASVRQLKDSGGATFESQYRCKNGDILDVEVSSRRLDMPGKRLWLDVWYDITERKLLEQNLRVAATAFESQEGMFVTDARNVILRVNQAFTDITGYTTEEAVGRKANLLKSGRHDAAFYARMWESLGQRGVWRGEVWNRRKNGEVYPEWLTITAVKDDAGEVTHYVATLTDITLRKAAEDEIKHLAFYDPLTRLPNRRLLLDRLRQALASTSRSGRNGALLFIDLDRFKTLNDTLGHSVGDLLLQQVGQRLATCIREGDTVARLGGDEFVVMLEDLNNNLEESTKQTEAVGEKILATLGQPYLLDGHEHHSTPSIGITLFRGHHYSIDELLKQADMAMYRSKNAGRNTLRFFDPEMDLTNTSTPLTDPP
jgi:diguanylate cyclase (GGDEF)-like protein/PAS domain S-box-containing protein